MRFETSEGTVVVKFRHTMPSVEISVYDPTYLEGNNLAALVREIRQKVIKRQGNTFCEVLLDVDKTGKAYTSFSGIAYTHENDNYNKETGRLESLKHALDFAIKNEIISKTYSREILAGYYAR